MPVVDEKPAAAFYVDVNSADDNGKVGTTPDSLVDGTDVGPVMVGGYVWAVDADHNACQALVLQMTVDWIELSMDESTWRPLAELAGQSESRADERVSLHGADPEDVLRAMLRSAQPEA